MPRGRPKKQEIPKVDTSQFSISKTGQVVPKFTGLRETHKAVEIQTHKDGETISIPEDMEVVSHSTFLYFGEITHSIMLRKKNG